MKSLLGVNAGLAFLPDPGMQDLCVPFEFLLSTSLIDLFLLLPDLLGQELAVMLTLALNSKSVRPRLSILISVRF